MPQRDAQAGALLKHGDRAKAIARTGCFPVGWRRKHCLVIPDPEHFPQQTKLIVTCRGRTVEFTILDSRECKVLVKDGCNFKEPAEGKILGTKKRTNESTLDTFLLGEWKLLPGRLLRMEVLAYDVGGKEYLADGINGVQIVYPSGASFDLWGK